jgi:hypothetical protein
LFFFESEGVRVPSHVSPKYISLDEAGPGIAPGPLHLFLVVTLVALVYLDRRVSDQFG